MSQIQASKLVAYAATGSPSNSTSVSKLVAYMILVPGDSGPDTSNRQGHVAQQIIRRS